MDIPNWLNNLTDKELMADNLQFMSLFISVYESMRNFVEDNIKYFLCNEFVNKDGKMEVIFSKKYKEEVLKVKENGHDIRSLTKKSFLWLKKYHFIDEDDYLVFEKVKQVRNKMAHEMLEMIYTELDENYFRLFFQMLGLYKKISQKWFVEIEAPIKEYKITDEVDIDGICNGNNLIIDLILDVLYNHSSDKIQKIIQDYKRETI